MSIDNSNEFLTDGPVAVIGAGLTGASWAALFAAHGRLVRLHDQDAHKLAAGLERARQNVSFLVHHNMADEAQAEAGSEQ